MTALSGKANAYTVAALRANTSADVAEEAEHSFKQAREHERRLLRKLHEVEHRRVRYYLFPKRTAQEVERLRENVVSLAEECVMAKVNMRRLRRKASNDAAHAERLRADANLLQVSENVRKEILERRTPTSSDGGDRDDASDRRRDELFRVTMTAMDSLSAQQEALKLLIKAGEILCEVRQLIAEVQISNSMEVVSESEKKGIHKQYHLKLAAWKAREAGKRIERAVVLNDNLPIRQLVESEEDGLLNLCDAPNAAMMGMQVVRKTISEIGRKVDRVDEMLKESVEMQDAVVERLQENIAGSSIEMERTSQELGRLHQTLMQREILAS